MAKFLPLWLLLLVSPTLAAESNRAAANAINALGLDLLATAAKPNESTLLSPYSIQVALAMTYAGAEGETKAQMAKVLHYPAGDVHAEFSRLRRQLDAVVNKKVCPSRGTKESIVLNVASRLFAQRGFSFQPVYLSILRKDYGSPLEQVDFQSNPSTAMKIINTWVEAQTHNRIRNLMAAAPLRPNTRLVLVNAIYIKAPWEEKFEKDSTKPELFYAPDETPALVSTMTQTEPMGYAKKSGYTAVSIPYIGHELQFLILLPHTKDGLAVMEKKLTPETFIQCSNMKPRTVILHLPKFKLQPPPMNLNSSLIRMGMTNAFNIPLGSADFSAMALRRKNDYLSISDVVHKTFIDVNEYGTEAAAATAVALYSKGVSEMESKPIEIRVDRPFLFAIQHRPSGACLFLGRMMKPSL